MRRWSPSAPPAWHWAASAWKAANFTRAASPVRCASGQSIGRGSIASLCDDRADAAAIGFDDDHLYREFAEPMNGRQLPFMHVPLKEARAVFQEWVDKPDKAPY